MWWIWKSAAGGAAEGVPWGMRGDVPLPGDYDGDGEDDLAVYRRSTGNVYVEADGCDFSRTIPVGTGAPVVGDFDGDGRADPGIYDPVTGWFSIALAVGAMMNDSVGSGGGIPVPRDYDGDGRTDFAVYRTDGGYWDIRRSSTSTLSSLWWGDPEDVPAPADFDGDGRSEIATFNTSTGWWWSLDAAGFAHAVQWGTSNDVPVPSP
jgi:hypothetical protein